MKSGDNHRIAYPPYLLKQELCSVNKDTEINTRQALQRWCKLEKQLSLPKRKKVKVDFISEVSKLINQGVWTTVSDWDDEWLLTFSTSYRHPNILGMMSFLYHIPST